MEAAAKIIEGPLQTVLLEMQRRFSALVDGDVATYIPELAKANPEHFAISIATCDGYLYHAGDFGQQFTIQSISKPFVYGLALDDHGVAFVMDKVGVEPSGDAFNAISLEPGTGRPRNPMINAGAITSTSLVQGTDAGERCGRVMEMFEAYAGRRLVLDEAVFESERATGHRNRAIGHLLKNAAIFPGEVDEVLDLYFKQCSLLATCDDLAMIAATLANGGRNPLTGVQAIGRDNVARVLSVMSTCGMYDFAGSWLYRVGIPAKSGVGGGIIAEREALERIGSEERLAVAKDYDGVPHLPIDARDSLRDVPFDDRPVGHLEGLFANSPHVEALEDRRGYPGISSARVDKRAYKLERPFGRGSDLYRISERAHLA